MNMCYAIELFATSLLVSAKPISISKTIWMYGQNVSLKVVVDLVRNDSQFT